VEKILRGDGGGIPGERSQAPPSQPASPAAKAQTPKQHEVTKKREQQTQERSQREPKEQQTTPAKKELNLKDLKLDDSTLALKFGNTPKNQPSASSPASTSSPTKSLSDYQAFSRPPGSGAAFFGSAGISDHLPNLPDGDITLLNAKANIYASFVRRVAIQVFTQLRSQGWERLTAQQIRQLSGFATVEAVLTPNGKFVRAAVIESSGSDAFDAVLLTSASKGTSDPNPPPGAQAKDGNIHFIFKARSWSQIGVSRRSGAPVEQRWLLLATGLE
jgi:TonB family protein